MNELAKVSEKVGFVGAGNMAWALIRGLVEGGFPPSQLLVSDIDTEKANSLSRELGIEAIETTRQLIAAAQVIVLAVKPGTIVPLLKEHRKYASDRLWISVAAGISTTSIEASLLGRARVVRVMPNTPALVGEGASGIASGLHATEEDLDLACSLLGAVGLCEVVKESMMDAVTGVSGSGPAYVMLMIEAMADGGVRAGLPRPTALKLAGQTLRGAATLMTKTGKHPAVLKDMVTSPGGTTIAGVAALERSGFRNCLLEAVAAAAERSKELSER